MSNKQLRWFYLVGLALVWGSSFILMKLSLKGLSPIQVGALRMIISAIFLLLVGFNKLTLIKKYHWKYIVLNALLGTFFPVFLFAYAVQQIDSGIVAILNSLTPFNTLIFGALVFGFAFQKKQIIGIIIGLIGTMTLILNGATLNPDQNYWFALLILVASIGYAFNVNMIKKHLNDLSALSITAGNFVLMIIPASIILVFTGFFSEFEVNESNMASLGYVTVLAVLGTGVAKILFNRIVQMTSPIFASSVTYLIPIVAIIWGVLDGEKLSTTQLVAGVIIIFGVYLVNKKK